MDPSQIAAVMIVASGAIHAVVNAILKSGGDKMASRALIDGFSAVLVAPAVLFLPLPHGAWGWLAASWAIHLVYLICLVKAFERGDMTASYPVMRGTAPALAALVAVCVFGEAIDWVTALGVGLVSTGVLVTGLSRSLDARSLGWSLATGATIAAYTVVDAQGVRAAPSAASYIAWVFLTLGFGIGGLFALWRGPVFVAAARSQWKAGLVAGGLSILTYGLALWAYRLGDTPTLAALRETSILFAMAIGVFALREQATAWRIGGAAVIAVGAAVLLSTA